MTREEVSQLLDALPSDEPWDCPDRAYLGAIQHHLLGWPEDSGWLETPYAEFYKMGRADAKNFEQEI